MSKKEIFRRCIVTNKIININQMIRIVKNKENKFFLEFSENNKHIQGRGAYVINEFEAIMQALERKILNRTFKSNISSDVYDNLKQEVKKYEEIKNQKKQEQH